MTLIKLYEAKIVQFDASPKFKVLLSGEIRRSSSIVFLNYNTHVKDENGELRVFDTQPQAEAFVDSMKTNEYTITDDGCVTIINPPAFTPVTVNVISLLN